MKNKKEKRCLIIGIVLSILFFYLDLNFPLGVAGGILYICVIAVCLLYSSRRLVLFFGLSSVVLTIMGFYFSPEGGEFWIAITNRITAIFSIMILCILGYRLLKKQEELECELKEQANTDSLTGIANRRYIMDCLGQWFKESIRYEHHLSILIVDIDDFKIINDTFGHLVGDEVIKKIVQMCKTALRESDIIGRFGGEEFIIVCPNTNRESAYTVASRILDTVRQADFSIIVPDKTITISIGMESLTASTLDVHFLVKAADSALYEAKKNGKDQVCLA